MSRRKPVLKNRVAPEMEVAVVDLATEQPTWSQETGSARRLAIESQRHPGTETDFPMVPRGATVGLSGPLPRRCRPLPRHLSGHLFPVRFGSSDGTSLHPHPAKRNHFFTRKRAAAEAAPIEPPSCPSWGLIRRCEGNFADTPPSFRPQYSDFACAKCGATRPAQATPRSGPACHRIACG